MNRRFLLSLSALLCLLLLTDSCKEDDGQIEDPNSPFQKYIPPSVQRSGDAEAGREFLIYGDYISSGVPKSVYDLAFGSGAENLLGRDGINSEIGYDYTAVTAPNGTTVVAPNCLQCHAQKLNGELIVGLGNSVGDFTSDQSDLIPTLDLAIGGGFGLNSPEYESYELFRKAVLAIGPKLVMDNKGVNPADQLAAVLASHRNINDLTWIDEPQSAIPEIVIPTDVPPWWLMKKKNTMFYTALGRGDFAKISMASGLLTLQDSTEARRIDSHFADVMAYIYSLEAPPYPESVDSELASEGRTIFENNCASCHGTYGANGDFPNLLIDIDLVGTDPLLIDTYEEYGEYIGWYNVSWFGKAPHAAELVAERGYFAQPLDGIWASAPYLHNGSVPNLEGVLNSTQRPTYWKRSFETDDYDYEHLGWNHSSEIDASDDDTYDTTLPGYGNEGHIFGDHLTDTERAAVIEYLKTI